ncbi:MAG: phospholipid carrier-dependent glycosyltransferase, partial [Candidatus Peribacteraceae bacterium]|nr:phospholipid carrier-dependent glycosyltransferase [Candidatus Peribacteraceae bacterium]
MKSSSLFSPSPRLAWWLCLAFVTALSFTTYMVRYDQPQAFFWDENYHVAAAQKYLSGVYFMEQHPPLGKLLIAAGEALVDANPIDNQFADTDYARNPPPDFKFSGYRLFPALLAWLTAPLLFISFWLIGRNLSVATFGAFLYAFDNALIVHSRGAMLESPLMFFSVATILGFLLMLHNADRKKELFLWSAVLFGAGFAAAVTTKVVGLILILLVPALLWILWPKRQTVLKGLGAAALAFGVV